MDIGLIDLVTAQTNGKLTTARESLVPGGAHRHRRRASRCATDSRVRESRRRSAAPSQLEILMERILVRPAMRDFDAVCIGNVRRRLCGRRLQNRETGLLRTIDGDARITGLPGTLRDLIGAFLCLPITDLSTRSGSAIAPRRRTQSFDGGNDRRRGQPATATEQHEPSRYQSGRGEQKTADAEVGKRRCPPRVAIDPRRRRFPVRLPHVDRGPRAQGQPLFLGHEVAVGARAAAGTRKPVIDGPRLCGPGDDQARKRIVEGKAMRRDDRPCVLLVAAAPAADPPRALRARRAELLDDNARRHVSVTRAALFRDTEHEAVEEGHHAAGREPEGHDAAARDPAPRRQLVRDDYHRDEANDQREPRHGGLLSNPPAVREPGESCGLREGHASSRTSDCRNCCRATGLASGGVVIGPRDFVNDAARILRRPPEDLEWFVAPMLLRQS